ncbi:protein kinase family protein [Acrocarpospora catenulata]|uniref:protein kinase family protein n=1 Tax=Acrocarpospora catenulata TaxID=2836182 RepID=UPI001BDB4189|nr:protein kinase family protein [Acrocarpospora catenulata]
MHHRDGLQAARLTAYQAISTDLSLLSDRHLGDAMAAATPHRSGIGGRSAELEVGGRQVFVKRVPLTDLETRPQNIRSTANLFRLPTFYQYGIGSAGFGAWRELAAHTMTTNWVLANQYAGFPLMYHWRILPDSPPEGFADEFGGIDGAVAHWEGSPAVRERLEAIGRCSLSLVLFLEHLPHTLAAWLTDHHDAAVWAEQALARGTAFMNSHRFVHFDAHFDNILTDGRLLYFADFGLALSSRFDLSAAEARFLSSHLTYDRYYTASRLLHHLLRNLTDGARGDTVNESFLRDWTAHAIGHERLPPALTTIIDRHAGPTLILDSFHSRLITHSRQTPYPADELELAEAFRHASPH